MTAEAKLEPSTVNVRIKISALWASMLFVFAYVDLFSLYRADFRADLEAGEVGGFTVNQSFLLGTTAYVVIPSLMVFCALILRPGVNRIANIALGIVYALTIIAGAIGEWNYYLLGSAIEVALLAALVYYAWTWPRENLEPPRPDQRPERTTYNPTLVTRCGWSISTEGAAPSARRAHRNRSARRLVAGSGWARTAARAR
jgi:Family of unknown function (DUF6326)